MNVLFSGGDNWYPAIIGSKAVLITEWAFTGRFPLNLFRGYHCQNFRFLKFELTVLQQLNFYLKVSSNLKKNTNFTTCPYFSKILCISLLVSENGRLDT